MRTYANVFLAVAGLFFFTDLFAQHGRYSRRYDRYAYYNRPYSYSYAPLRASVSIVARLPFGAVALTFGNRHYHYYDGMYYEPMPGGYAIVEPPVGLIVPVLPPSAVYVIIGGRPYYRYQTAYYLPLDNHRYQVVQEPMADESAQTQKPANSNVATDGYEKFVLEGKTYYRKGGKYYKARINDNGEIIYEEVGETSK